MPDNQLITKYVISGPYVGVIERIKRMSRALSNNVTGHATIRNKYSPRG